MKYYKEENGKVIYSDGKVLYNNGTSTLNPTEEQMLEAGWQVYVEPEPTNAEKLAAAKADKIMQIETYDASDAVEEFIINGNPMWLGHELRQQIKTSAEAYAAAGYENMTKVFNGAEFTFPIATWVQMLNALEIYAAEALNTTERHKNSINLMDNIQDVIDYDYTTGYPLKLVFGKTED